MDQYEVGDVFRDGQDRLWKCIMVTDSNAIIRHAKRTEPDMILPRDMVAADWLKYGLKWCWNEKQPGIVQTSKVNPDLN